jgi:TPP-dependent pyruvate/acetoin dehydrogenase alpha subunit
MPTKKPAEAPKTAAGTKQFSLVSSAAQQEMYRAIRALKPAKDGLASGAEIAEIAVCTALGANDPVIAACPARGARSVRKAGRMAGGGGRLVAATLSGVGALLADSKAAALICAGTLEAKGKGKEDYCSAFGFAARHKLPILFLVANRMKPKGRQEVDLSKLHAELGIPVFSVDADDAIAAYRVATEALHNARHLRGPCVIEALTLPGHRGGSAVSALDLLRGYMERHGNRPL